MKKQFGEHAPVLRTWMLILSLAVTAGAMVFAGIQTWLLRNSVVEQTAQTKLSERSIKGQTYRFQKEKHEGSTDKFQHDNNGVHNLNSVGLTLKDSLISPTFTALQNLP